MIFSPFGFRQEQVSVAPTPSIPTSGLTLYLDAGNSSSYPGSGTSWYDLSGNGNTGTLNNGITYSSADGGSLLFDNVDDYVSFSSVSGMPTGNTNYTTIVFFNTPNVPGGASAQRGFIGWGQYGSTKQVNAFRLGRISEVGSGGGFINYWWASDYTRSTTIDINVWYSAVVTYNGSNRQFYKNNSSSGMSSMASSALNVTRQDNLTIGRTYTSEYYPGNISVVIVYNRTLDSIELTQVWDAFKGRYGY
jgi:hypothetical protein